VTEYLSLKETETVPH